ncbi:uncharacterized protein LOC115689397 [Syzygium oleosum]|uniref:uncharacterized protein LOC115689397 n=1 Tax=Syzygium oleosum TaxID=219896 RepID=UPI0011D1D6C1|nr:uncharacterized protein LOC115689397 [Syzygium oleosum]
MSEGEDNGVSGGVAVGDSEEFNEHHINEGVFTPDMTATPIREKHKLHRTPNFERRRKSNTYCVSGTCKAIQEMIKFRTGQSTSGSVTLHAPPLVNPYSIGVVVAILNGMPNLEHDLYNKAMNQACLNATWKEAFIISLPERRRGLLESL